MKRIFTFIAILLFLFCFSSSAFAMLMPRVGVNPFVDPNYSGFVTTGPGGGYLTARVDVYLDQLLSLSPRLTQPYAFNQVSLDFGSSPIFAQLFGGDVLFGSVLTPPTIAGWSGSLIGGPFFPQIILNGPVTNHIAFTFQYKLAASVNASKANPFDYWGSHSIWSLNGDIYEIPDVTLVSEVDFSTVLVPEPGSLILLGLAIFGLGIYRIRRRRERM